MQMGLRYTTHDFLIGAAWALYQGDSLMDSVLEIIHSVILPSPEGSEKSLM